MRPLIVFEEPVISANGRYYSESSWLGYAIDIAESFGGGTIWAPLGDKGVAPNEFSLPNTVKVDGVFLYKSFSDYYKKYIYYRSALVKKLTEAVLESDFVLVRAPSQLASLLNTICSRFDKPLVVMYAGDFIQAAGPLQKSGWRSIVLRQVARYIDGQQRRLGSSAVGIISIGQAVLDRYKLSKPSLILSDSTVYARDVGFGLDGRHEGSRPLRLIRVASYLPNKNYELLFEVVRRLRLGGWRGDVACFGLIQNGEYYEHLCSSAPDGVTLNGPLPAGEAVLKAFLNSDVQVICSRSEGIPRTILEGAASGVALVSLAVGGIPSLVTHEENALLVPLMSDQGCADGLIEAILRIDSDRCLFSKLVVSGLDLAMTNTREVVIERIRSFVCEVIRND